MGDITQQQDPGGWRKSSYSSAYNGCVEFKVEWQKSSHSMANGDCVEFKVSSHCDGGACVEVAVPGEVLVRDSKLGAASPILSFTPAAWAMFLGQVRAGI